MLSVWMVLAGGAMLAVSGLPACLLPARSLAGQRISAGLMLIGGALGLTGVAISLSQAQPMMLSLPWFLPWGRFAAAIDPLSAVFLVLVFIVPALGSVYGLGYWPAPEHPESSRRLGVFYGLLAGAMALVTVARDGVLFLIAWEVMALAAYFAATAQENNPQVRRAGWVYLVATHAGTLCLLAMFALWRSATGSFALEAVKGGTGLSAELAGAIFVLAVIGFGFKAGLMPLHVWLPGTHASAPSHVSAVMSGVMLKMGVYGLVRMTALLPELAAWWGGALLAMGAVTGVAGIALAVGQDDLKRLLAYSSIENIGVIAMGLGLALLGRSRGQPQWVALGLAGCLLHVWNHGLFKPLLFWGAGAVIHATGTRRMDRLGGLAKRMPQVTALFVAGAVAISALPPMNGFVSEWLLYVGLFSTLGGVGQEGGLPAAAAGAVVLAMIGALAVVCFVKVVGVVFLGSPREAGLSAHDPPASMRVPMMILAASCAGVGLFPWLVVPMLEGAVETWAGEMPTPIASSALLGWITVVGLALVALAGGLFLAMRAMARARAATGVGTWDCGYAQPTARVQYTGSSWGQMVGDLFAFILWPRRRGPVIRGIFPGAARFRMAVPDVVLDRLVRPAFDATERRLLWLRVLQQGQTHWYVLYVLVIVIVLLAWGALGVGHD